LQAHSFDHELNGADKMTDLQKLEIAKAALTGILSNPANATLNPSGAADMAVEFAQEMETAAAHYGLDLSPEIAT
jgi:hypothetical protein